MLKLKKSSLAILGSTLFFSGLIWAGDAVPAGDPGKTFRKVLFDPKENGIDILPAEINYALGENNDFQIGGQVIKGNAIDLKIEKIANPKDAEGPKYNAIFSWPEIVAPYGKFRMRKGKRFFYYKALRSSDVALPETQPAVVPNIEKPVAFPLVHYTVPLTLQELKHWMEFNPFRFCLDGIVDDKKQSLCSKGFMVVASGADFEVRDAIEESRKRNSKKKVKETTNQYKIGLDVVFSHLDAETKKPEVDTTSLAPQDDFMVKYLKITPNENDPPLDVYMLDVVTNSQIPISDAKLDRASVETQLRKWEFKHPFKVCVGLQCSEELTYVSLALSFNADLGPGGAPQQVILNDESVPIEDDLKLDEKKNDLFVQVVQSNGAFYEFRTGRLNPAPEYVDAVRSSDGKGVILTGRGTIPEKATVDSKISDQWQLPITGEKGFIFLKGQGRFFSTQRYKIKNQQASEEDRTYITASSPTGTYGDHITLHGGFTNAIKQKVESKELEIKMTGADKFDWNYSAPVAPAFNSSHVTIIDGDKKFKANYRLFRDMPNEMGMNLSWMGTDRGNMLFLNGLRGKFWFDQVFGSTNEKWSVMRWGGAFDFWQTIGFIPLAPGATEAFYAVHGDIHYKMQPSLWNRQETYGGGLSYEFANNTGAMAHLVGINLFYGRPLFRVVDDILNKWSLLRYPKWLDLELRYYPLTLTPNMVLGVNSDLSFSIKGMIKDRFYGRIGAMVMAYDFRNPITIYHLQTVTALFTLGGGMLF